MWHFIVFVLQGYEGKECLYDEGFEDLLRGITVFGGIPTILLCNALGYPTELIVVLVVIFVIACIFQLDF